MAQVLIILLFCSSLFGEFNVKSWKEIRYSDVIKQSFEESCGVSAFATLLNLDRNTLSEKELIKDINTTDAISLYTLEKLAKKYNYKSKSYKIDKKILKTLKFPVIARVARDKNYPHFVVIKVKKDHILMLDPNYGKYRVSYSEFEKIWTKHVFVILPKNKFKEIESLDIIKFSYLSDLE